MKKYIIVILAALFLVMAVSGCVQMHTHLTINKDGSGEIEYTVGLDSALVAIADREGDLLAELESELESQGFVVSSYTEDTYSGFKAVRAIEDIRKLTKDGLSATMGGIMGAGEGSFDDLKFKEDRGLFFSRYRLDGSVDFQGILAQARDYAVTQKMLDAITNRADLKFILTTPLEPQLHNATKVSSDGKTLTWDIVPGVKNDFLLEIEVPNVINIVLFASSAPTLTTVSSRSLLLKVAIVL